MSSSVDADWMAIDPSLWRVRVHLPEDPAEELWRTRLRRRRADALAAAIEEPAPALAPFFGEANWRRDAQEDRALVFEPDGSLRWTLPFPNPELIVFPLRSSTRLWIQEVLPDGRLWHAYFSDPSPQTEGRAPLRALAALIDAMPAAEPRANSDLELGFGPEFAGREPIDAPRGDSNAQDVSRALRPRSRKGKTGQLLTPHFDDLEAEEQPAASLGLQMGDAELSGDPEAMAFAAEFLRADDSERSS